MNPKPRQARAFSLIEVAVVCGVILLLAAILLPVLMQAKKSALKSRDLSHLKQIGTALLLYRSNCDHSEAGTAQEMGLPTSDEAMMQSGILAPGLSPTGPNPHKTIFLYTHDPVMWVPYSREFEGRVVLAGDLAWTDPSVDSFVDDGMEKSAAGVYIDGHVKRFVKKGDPIQLNWWHSE